MKNYTVESAKVNFEEMLEHAQHGLTTIITSADNKDYELILKPLPANKPRKPGSAKGRVKLAADFYDPLPEFQASTE